MSEEFSPGVVVEAQGVGGGTTYWSEVKAVGSQRLELWAPRSGPWDLSFRLGREMLLKAPMADGEILQSRGKVVGLEEESGGWIVLQVLDQPHREPQRRKELRIPVNIPAGLTSVEWTGKGTVKNLSASGCIVATQWDGGNGVCLALALEMPEGRFQTGGRLLSSTQNAKMEPTGTWLWSVRFERMSDEEDAVLVRYIYEYQRKHGVWVVS